MGLNKEEDQKRKLIDLSIEAGRKRQSPQTGFIHFCYEHPYELRQDTIPLLENFCFVLSLFRTRLSDPILEGKALLEKLLCFESQGNFPVYLHQYPSCKDRSFSVHLLPIFHYLLKDFSSVLGEELLRKLDLIAHRVMAHAESAHAQRPLAPSALAKLQAYKQNFDPNSWEPHSAQEWGEYLMALQMNSHSPKESFKKAISLWNPSLFVFVGECKDRFQDKGEPLVTLFDLFMGEYFRSFSDRALSDSALHIKASLVHPFPDVCIELPSLDDFQIILEKDKKQHVSIFWGNRSHTHSLVFEVKKGTCEIQRTAKGLDLLVCHDPELPLEEENAEIAFYCDDSSLSLFINEQRANTFKLEDTVKMVSSGVTAEIQFSTVEGNGRFFGHISKSNRSSQINRQETYAAYDWKIGLRTINRSSYTVTRVSLAISASCGENAGLSTATPMACNPLST